MSAPLHKETILIVDDAPPNIKVLGEALKTDYKIRLATNGKKALEIARSSNPPDLILLDIMMPEMDGYEVCRRLKTERKTQNIPIIFITGMNEVADETRGLELGAVDYITKPFSIPIVKARVKTHMELKRHRDLLENLSALDGLTGIPNRRRFDEHLHREWLRCIREPNPLSIIMIDIDDFKAYNDTYGHGAGDECLKMVSRALADAARRPMDFVARYGGEEFVCVLSGTDLQGATRVGETMRREIELLDIPHAHSQAADRVTVSLGVATVIPTKETSPEKLIRGADAALYKVKEEGRNHVRSVDLNIDHTLEFGNGPMEAGIRGPDLPIHIV